MIRKEYREQADVYTSITRAGLLTEGRLQATDLLCM